MLYNLLSVVRFCAPTCVLRTRVFSVLALLVLLAGCWESTDEPSAWISGSGTLRQVGLPAGDELNRSQPHYDIVVGADAVNRSIWYLNQRGQLTRRSTQTGTTLVSMWLPRSYGGSQQEIEAHPGTGGVFTLFRGKITHISSDGQVLASIGTIADDIRFDPLREILWTIDRRKVVAYDTALQEVYRFSPSSNRDQIKSFGIEPDSGHVLVLHKRSILHLDETAQLLSELPSRRKEQLVVSRGGSYFTSQRHRLTHYAADGSVLQQYQIPTRDSIVDMATDWESGELWVLTQERLYQLANGALVAVYPQSGSGSNRWGRGSRARFRQLELMGGVPTAPDIQIVDPPAQTLVPLVATVSFSVSSNWYQVNPADLTVLVDGVEQPPVCSRPGTDYQCEITLDNNRFSPQIQIAYTDTLGQQSVSNALTVILDANANGIADAEDDDDGDGLTNQQEQSLGTDRNRFDTDGDLIPDGLELTLGLNPLLVDTNGDGVSDGDEDADADDLSNALELQYNSDPQNPDTDSDGLTDGLEVLLNLSPVDADSDADGISDYETDSDGDGLGNGLELELNLIPLYLIVMRTASSMEKRTASAMVLAICWKF